MPRRSAISNFPACCKRASSPLQQAPFFHFHTIQEVFAMTMELLSPAGDPERLRMAVAYGAE